MKVLIISFMFPGKRHPTSGIFFANLMKALAVKVEELIVITPRVYIPRMLMRLNRKWEKWYLDPVRSTEDGIEIFRPFVFNLRGSWSMGINGIFTGFSLIKLCKSLITARGIDIILGYNMIPEAIAAVFLARKMKLPVGFWAIGSDVNEIMPSNLLNYHLSKMCIKKSDLIITESKDLEQKIRQLCQQPLNIHTFYKGIDVANFQNLPAKNILLEKLGLDHAKKYLLFVGRIIKEKGINELAQSFIKIAKGHPDLDLIMIGEEIEKKNLLTMFESAGISQRVHFKGIISHKEVAYYMKAADVLVHPSWAEGLPNAIMEAMACELAVVASDVGGIPEVLINGVTGLSVPAKNSEKLAQAIIEMLANDQLRRNCVRQANELITGKFDVKKNVFQLYDLLQKLCAQPMSSK